MPPAPLQGIADFSRLKWRFAHLRGERLRHFQRRECGRLVSLALRKSPFYGDLYAGRDLSDFQSLPTINKAVMMREFDRLNTEGIRLEEAMEFALSAERDKRYLGYYRDRYVVGLSSGTSGNRGLYLTDRSISERLPYVFLARSGIPWRLLPFRIAFFLRVFNQGFSDINGPLISLEHLPTMLPVGEAIERINALRANVLMGPPSLLRLLARERHRITSPVGIVVSYAEVLEAHERSSLERAFGARIVEIYQASEGLIACPCSEGRLHINEDLMLVELLDEKGSEVTEPGTPSRRMIVTNLYNEVQPLIRYELNDLAVLGEPCECGSGFRVIDRVIGRDDDILYFRRSDGRLGHVFPDVMSRWIITASGEIQEYMVEQHVPARILVRLELDRSADEDEVSLLVSRSIARGLEEHGFSPATIEIRTGPVERGGGKYKRFRRSFGLSEAEHPVPTTQDSDDPSFQPPSQ
jgi:putative adenylate-forming enzyme